MEDRTLLAFNLLNNYKPGNYTYLGSGFSGVVFHDGLSVYKVHIPVSSNNYNEIDNILYLRQKLHIFSNRQHFYPLSDLLEFEGVFILIYPYEPSEKVISICRDEMISFLAEMWRMKVICKSITKENNFIRVNGLVKLIDYEIEPYSDNLFLNVAVRAFIQLNDFGHKNLNYDKLKRSVINNFSLPELSGLFPFIEQIFRTISGISTDDHTQQRNQALEKKSFTIEYKGGTFPSVTLLIKCCVQDSESIFSCVQHITKQLPPVVQFSEKVLLLDLYKQDRFLRQYTATGQKGKLLLESARLLREGYIDRILIAPSEQAEIKEINSKWFGIDSIFTHTHNAIPVTSQIYAFDQITSDFIMQMDCDVLIGSRDLSHNFLKNPIEFMSQNENVISAGFQICQNPEIQFQPFSGLTEGGYAPDVRCSLIHRERLLALLPLPNENREHGLRSSWYRALQKKQVDAEKFSVHGGDTRTFYIHPQNYRKESRKVWWTVMNAVEDGRIPGCQYGEPEVKGSIFDWTTPKRKEALVVILLITELNHIQFWETLESILSQDFTEIGLIIINNSNNENSKHKLRELLPDLPFITLINTEYTLPVNEVIYDAIHYYIEDPDSFICMMQNGDILLGKTVFSEIMNCLSLYKADVLLGKEISKTTLSSLGLSFTNFTNPRDSQANLDNGLQVFRKILFDSLNHLDLKQKSASSAHLPGYIRMSKSYQWINDSSFISILAPIIELAVNPIRFDHFNVLRLKARTYKETRLFLLNEIQGKTPKNEGDLVGNRKMFLPNLSRIELDITYECNLSCLNCNRSCSQAPSKEQMHLSQIIEFVEDSVSSGKHWELINILGGEPTLHPEFGKIVDYILQNYIDEFSPHTTLQVTSNGFGNMVKSRLNNLPQHPNLIIDYNSFKDKPHIPYFTPFNLAPIDDGLFNDDDYRKGCWVTSYCGISLNHLGYFPCGIAGGMERVMKSKQAIKSLKNVNETIQGKLSHFCRYCGNFSAYHMNKGDFMERAEKDSCNEILMSETWKIIYAKYLEQA